MPPTLSVVLGTYNGERFLEAQLRSLLGQTLPPCEIVVSDDCSSDRTIAIVEAVAASSPVPIRLQVNPRTLGYAENFLAASSLARGDLIAFCDQDDVWAADKIERCVAAFTARTVLVVHTATLIDANDAVVGLFGQGIRRDATKPPLSHDPWGVYFGFSMVFRRDLLDIIPYGMRGVDYITGRPGLAHDRWVLFLANLVGDVVELAAPLVGYRQHGANVFGAGAGGPANPSAAEVLSHATRYVEAAREQRALVELVDAGAETRFPQFDRGAARRFWEDVEHRQVSRARLYGADKRAAALRFLCSNVADGVYRAVHDRRFRLRSFARDLHYAVSADLPASRVHP